MDTLCTINLGTYLLVTLSLITVIIVGIAIVKFLQPPVEESSIVMGIKNPWDLGPSIQVTITMSNGSQKIYINGQLVKDPPKNPEIAYRAKFNRALLPQEMITLHNGKAEQTL